MEKYPGIKLKTTINIGKLYSVHYFEYPANFKFEGESHDFWEAVYADKGDITVFADDREFILPQGNIFFHKPNQWHTLHCSPDIANNVAIISFECTSPDMSFFEDKMLTVGQEDKTIISKIISEYTGAFSTPLNDPYTTRITRKKEAICGSEQLVKQYIAELIISFLRGTAASLSRSQMSINRESALCNMLVNYMVDHITESISINELVRYSGFNKTTIASVFRNTFDMSIMEYFINLKIDLAKKYLRENNYNISQISYILGYSSIHYFSRQFKKVTGLSPGEYCSSIKAIVEKK